MSLELGFKSTNSLDIAGEKLLLLSLGIQILDLGIEILDSTNKKHKHHKTNQQY